MREAFGNGRIVASMDDEGGHGKARQKGRDIGEQVGGFTPPQQAHKLPRTGEASEGCIERLEGLGSIRVIGGILGDDGPLHGDLPECELDKRCTDFPKDRLAKRTQQVVRTEVRKDRR